MREIGAGVALHPNAMKVLRSLGLEDDVRAVAGRSEWALTRNGKTGRVISKTSRAQQGVLFGTTGATVHRADLLDVLANSLPRDIVTLGARCVGVEPDGRVAVARFRDGSEVEAAALAAEPEDPVAALALYERARRRRASQIVLAARERGVSNHLASPLSALRRDVSIALRRRLRRDPDGRGTRWIPEYDATSPDVLAA